MIYPLHKSTHRINAEKTSFFKKQKTKQTKTLISKTFLIFFLIFSFFAPLYFYLSVSPKQFIFYWFWVYLPLFFYPMSFSFLSLILNFYYSTSPWNWLSSARISSADQRLKTAILYQLPRNISRVFCFRMPEDTVKKYHDTVLARIYNYFKVYSAIFI